MFKKLITNLPFSPGLIDQMSFYVRRLRQEEIIRRVAMIFTALSIAVQIVSMLVPPSYAQASNTNNIVFEAVPSKQHLLNVWDSGDTAGNKDIDDIFKFFGVTRADIEKVSVVKMSSTENFNGYETWTMGRKAYNHPGEYAQNISTNEGKTTTVYLRPWAKSWGNYTTDVIRGKTAGGQDFAVIMNCGNLVIAIKDPPKPQPVLGDFRSDCSAIWGWAYDPRKTSLTVKVRIDVDNKQQVILDANQPNQYVNNIGVSGNHGFRWNIPDRYLDGNNHSITVIALEDASARGISEGNQVLVSSNGTNVIKANCKPPEPEKITVCRPGVGIITINKTDLRNDDYQDTSQCDLVQICVNDKMVSVYRHEAGSSPRSCPEIQVCRDGVVITITTDKKLSSDQDPSMCDELQVCLDGVLTVILKGSFDSEIHSYPYVNSFGQATCQPPESVFSQSKTATNLTQDVPNADGTTASPADEIRYFLTTANTGTLDGTFSIIEDLEDVLEYSDLIDLGGGVFDEQTQVLSWSDVAIKAGESITHSFVVKVKSPLPTTAQSTASPDSFDFMMTNVYGNAVNISLPRTLGNQVEHFATTLPNTGPAENAMFSGLFVALVFFFYFRNRLITKELNIIKREFSGA